MKNLQKGKIKHWVIVICPLIIFASIFFCIRIVRYSNIQQDDNLKTYTNSFYRFEFKYPESYEIVDNSEFVNKEYFNLKLSLLNTKDKNEFRRQIKQVQIYVAMKSDLSFIKWGSLVFDSSSSTVNELLKDKKYDSDVFSNPKFSVISKEGIGTNIIKFNDLASIEYDLDGYLFEYGDYYYQIIGLVDDPVVQEVFSTFVFK